MKINIFHIAIACIITLSSCQPEGADGVFNPKKKIDKTSTSLNEGTEMTEKVFTWNNNLLKKIDYYDNGEYSWTANYTYDNQNRVIAIIDDKFDEKTEFIYDGAKLSKIIHYEDNKVDCSTSVEYKGNKISKFIYTIPDPDKAMNARINPFDAFTCSEISAIIIESIQHLVSKKQTKSQMVVHNQLTWKEHNVVKMDLTSPEGNISLSLKYDNKVNPLQGCYTLEFSEPEDESIFNLCTNNITEATISMTDFDFVQSYTYTYSDKYPSLKNFINVDGERETLHYYYK